MNTIEAEIRCNDDDILLLIHPSLFVRPQIATASIDPLPSFADDEEGLNVAKNHMLVTHFSLNCLIPNVCIHLRQVNIVQSDFLHVNQFIGLLV